jgi:octaprenyl-diphosphate synthase
MKEKLHCLSFYFFKKINKSEKELIKNLFSKSKREKNDLENVLKLIKKHNVINECYKKAQHYIELASSSLSIFKDCDQKEILNNLTSFSLARNF